MKLFREAYKLLASDALKSILLILQTAGFIILFNISLGTVNTAKFLANKVEDTNLKFSYYYSYGQAGIQNGHDGKELIDIAVPKYFCPSYKSTLITAYCFSDDFLKENELCMKNGGRVSSLSNNECVISYDFAKAMKIKKGDTVELLYNELPVKLLVKGILHRDEQIIKFTVSGNDLSLKSIYEKPKSAIIFTSCTAVDMSEMETFPCGIYKNKDNYTQKEIEDIYGEYGEIASFESMLNEEKEENKSIVMFFNSLAVVLLIVTFINVTANNFLILEFQEKRFGIYYLYGMSFSGIFRITFIRNLIMIGVSCIIGLGILSYIRRFSYIDEFSFNISSLICSIGIVALLTFMSEIPLHLKMKRTEPIRFFAEGLE